MIPSAGPRSQCIWAGKGDSRGVPQVATVSKSASEAPSGTDSSGMFGTSSIFALSVCSTSASVFSSSAIRSPTCRISARTCSTRSGSVRATAPIWRETSFRRARSVSLTLSSSRRRSSSETIWSIMLESSWRRAIAALTISGCSLISCRLSKRPLLLDRPQLREEDHLADRRLVGQEHGQSVDPDAQATGRRHAVLERDQEVLVERVRLLVAGPPGRGLLLEARPLVARVVQLGERVAQLEATGVPLEPLDETVSTGPALGQRRARELDRVVDQEGRLDQPRLDPGREQLVEDLAAVPVRPDRQASLDGRRGQAVPGRVLLDVDLGVLEDRLEQRHPPPRWAQLDRLPYER